MKDFLSWVQYFIAPILAPVPTALVVGISLNHTLSLLPDAPWWLALIGGISGAVAVELGGGLMFSNAAYAFSRRKWVAMVLAVFGAITYAGIVIYAAYIDGSTGNNALIGTVLGTFIIYLGKGIKDYLNDSAVQAAALDNRADMIFDRQHSNQIELRRLELQAQELEIKRIRAENKTGNVQRPNNGGRRSGQFQPDERLAQAVRDYYAKNPNASYRDAGSAIGCSPMTARKYKPTMEATNEMA